jgi:hypothetical protein
MVVPVFAVGTLVGCGPPFTNNSSPFELGLENGHLAFSFCQGETVIKARVEQRPSGSSEASSWEDVWSGSGRLVVKAGDVIELGGEGALSATEFSPVDPSPGTKYTVYLTVESRASSGGTFDYQPSFTSPAGGLQDGEWLDSSGGVSGEPCS